MSIRPSPPLLALAEFAHDELRHGPETVIAALSDDSEVHLGLWSPPGADADLVTALVGWTAPEGVQLIGVADDGEGHRRTTILDRAGRVVTVDGDGSVPRPTSVLIADLLARVFELPTPPPPVSVATWFDLRWLDRLAEAVFAAEVSLDIADLLALHPLHRPEIDSPEALRGLVEDTARRCSWATLRACSDDSPSERSHPPGGTVLAGRDWFDDGSFARQLLARLAPPDQLIGDLALMLSERLLGAIGAGLAGLGPHR